MLDHFVAEPNQLYLNFESVVYQKVRGCCAGKLLNKFTATVQKAGMKS